MIEVYTFCGRGDHCAIQDNRNALLGAHDEFDQIIINSADHARKIASLLVDWADNHSCKSDDPLNGIDTYDVGVGDDDAK